MDIVINNSCKLKGCVNVPGDKSISHRAAMLLPLCYGNAVVSNFLFSEDCIRTLNAMRMLGADINNENGVLLIKGNGKETLKPALGSIYLGNSGTSMRLLSGIFSAIKGKTLIYGDNSLNKRPMGRIIKPLTLMGAEIKPLGENSTSPLLINGKELNGIDYEMKVASAQVKSAILIASLFSKGETSIKEKIKTRDHTERMLRYLGAKVIEEDTYIKIKCGQDLESKNINIPGDMSSAAFLIAVALISRNSDITVRNVLYNDTRNGFIDIVVKMGANLEIFNRVEFNNEARVDIRIKSSNLNGIIIDKEDIPGAIDEIPLISVLAACANGTTIIKGAEELRYKESDRIKTVVLNLKKIGIDVVETDDGMIINGCSYNKSNKDIIFDSYNDHRIAMAFSLFGMIFDRVKVLNCNNIRTSFPQFVQLMRSIGVNISEEI